jgi:hypothetical protein
MKSNIRSFGRVMTWLMMIMLSFGLMSCSSVETTGRTAGPKAQTWSYRDSRLAFNYPQSWRITENNQSLGLIFLEDKSNALVTMMFFKDKSVAPAIKAYADEYARKVGENIPIGKVVKKRVVPLSAKETPGAKSYRCEFDILLMGVAVPHVAIVSEFQKGNQKVILTTQAATEDKAAAEEAFSMVRRSLKILP